VEELGGRRLFNHYPSLGHALMAVYPTIPWQILKFSSSQTERVPKGYWTDKRNLMKLLIDAEETLGIKKVRNLPLPSQDKKQICTPQIEDWYSIKLSDLEELGFPTSFRKSDLVDLLNERYPGHEWEKANLLQGRFGQQKKLERAIASLFPVSLPLTNYNSKSN